MRKRKKAGDGDGVSRNLLWLLRHAMLGAKALWVCGGNPPSIQVDPHLYAGSLHLPIFYLSQVLTGCPNAYSE